MDGRIHRRLLAESELIVETAHNNLQVMQVFKAMSSDLSKDIHHVQSKVDKETSPACYHCGKTNHTSSTCHFNEVKCYLCRTVVIMVEGSGFSLLRRNWLSQLKLDWTEMKLVAQESL